MRNKRVLSLCFAILMLFTSIGAGAAEDTAKPEPDSGLAIKAEILGALGVAKISAGSLSEDSTVSRETFSEGIVSMMLDDLAGGGLSPVGDLSEEDIGMLYLRSIGILNGTGENVFEPNSPVTLEQAAKIAVSALGFGEISEYKGGYFIGYVNEARRLGLLDGIGASASEELSTADYVNLMYNLLDVDILERKTFGTSDTYYRTDGNTLISVYRNIRKGEGVVTANRYSGLYSENSGTSADKVTIGSEDYAIGETNAGNSLGLYAEFYYYDNPRENEDKKLLYITTEKYNDRLLITEDKISGYSGGTYTYEDENGRNRSVKIPSDAVILYNGVFKASLEADKFIPTYGSVEFISNDGDAAYEVVKIENITVTSVLSVSADGLAVYDKYEPEYNLSLEDKDYTVTLENGKDGTVLNILKDSIAETLIADGGDRQYYDIRIVTDSVSGTVEIIQSINIKKLDEATSEEELVSVPDKIFADGKEYKTSVRFKNLVADGKLTAPEAGKAYVFLLNGRGEIADIGENPEKPYRIGYVKRFATADAAFSPKYKIRLLDESGAWETYDLADKIRFNGSSTRAEKLKGLDSCVGKVCKYELNVAGEVTSLYFPSEMDDSFRTVYSMKDPYFRKYYGSPVFGPKSEDDGITCSIKSTSVVFVIPNFEPSSVDENSCGYQYAVIPPSKLPNYITYGNVEIYNTEGDIGVGDIAVVKMKTHGYVVNENSTRPVLVNEIRSVWDEEEIKTEVVALSTGKEIRFYVEDMRPGGGELPFKPGDLIFCFLAGDRTLRLYDDAKYYHILFEYDDENPVFTKAFDWNSGSTIGVSYRSSMAGDVRIRYGSVYKTDGEYLWLNTSDNPADTSAVEATKFTSARIYVYDKDEKKYSVGKATDIVGYMSDKVNYSKAVVVYTDTYEEIVIY